jgi:hypothetical protein
LLDRSVPSLRRRWLTQRQALFRATPACLGLLVGHDCRRPHESAYPRRLHARTQRSLSRLPRKRKTLPKRWPRRSLGPVGWRATTTGDVPRLARPGGPERGNRAETR